MHTACIYTRKNEQPVPGRYRQAWTGLCYTLMQNKLWTMLLQHVQSWQWQCCNNYIVDNLFLGFSTTLFKPVDINHVHEQVFRFYSCRIAHLYTSYNYLHVYCKMNINRTTIGTHKTASNSNNLTTVLLKSTNWVCWLSHAMPIAYRKGDWRWNWLEWLI